MAIFVRIIILLSSILIAFSIGAKSKSQEKSQPSEPTVLQVIQQDILINNQPAKIFNIVQPNGMVGYTSIEGKQASIILENKTPEWISIYWQGMKVPNNQDGVPFITQSPIPPNGKYLYQFPLNQSGAFWIRSHYKIQQQQLLAAPVIIYNPKNMNENKQNILMFLQDFSFQNPKDAYINLRQKFLQKEADMQLIASMPNQKAQPYINNQPSQISEIAFDAYLTNHHTLANPDIVPIHAGEIITLHIINASGSSNFFIDLGMLNGAVIAVDNQPIKPLFGNIFQLGMNQSMDIDVKIPEGINAAVFPILARAANTSSQTGLLLAMSDANIPQLPQSIHGINGKLDYSQELNLQAAESLPSRSADRIFSLTITGNPISYLWAMNGEVWPKTNPLLVKPDERIQLIFNNQTTFPIAFNLHGHLFQIIKINETEFKGAIRDTVLVLPKSSVTVQFDTNNPGIWLLRGDIPYDIKGGVMTLLKYEDATVPKFNQQDTGLPPSS